jgi:hypothetical protein
MRAAKTYLWEMKILFYFENKVEGNWRKAEIKIIRTSTLRLYSQLMSCVAISALQKNRGDVKTKVH